MSAIHSLSDARDLAGAGAIAVLSMLLGAGGIGASAPVQPATATAASYRVTCRVPHGDGERVLRLEQDAADTWTLAVRSRETRDAWVTLALPRAVPVVEATRASLSYRNANGGRQVFLEVTPAGARLDVWVDHGLEVNLEPDLDPRVDLMKTDGRIDATCVIEPRP